MQKRAERIGGKICVDTRPGRGTRVTAIIPLCFLMRLLESDSCNVRKSTKILGRRRTLAGMMHNRLSGTRFPSDEQL